MLSAIDSGMMPSCHSMMHCKLLLCLARRATSGRYAVAHRDRPNQQYCAAGMWRQRPAEFEIDGLRPVPAVFEAAHDAWQEIVQHESDVTLVVTHKSVLRALVCVALGLGPTAFRAVDIHNSGVSIFWVNTEAEAMLQNLNLTMHLSASLKY